MTLPRLHAMIAYWKEFPPVGEMVAGFAGYKPPTAPGVATLPLLDNAALTAQMHTDPRFLNWMSKPPS